MARKLFRSLILIITCIFIARCSTSPLLKELPVPVTSRVPKRVMILVFDQLRPDLIEQFELKNFLKLKSAGISFPNAIVGHLGSVTVVSHPVITTGLFPKHLPWQDEIFKDVQGKLGVKGTFYSALDLQPEQFKTLLSDTRSVSLLSRLQTTPSDQNHVYTLGQKQYAVMGMAAPNSGSVITLSEKLKSPSGWRAPSGFSVPSYFTQPFLGRFYLDCNPTYGSEITLYPLDGNRFAPGNDPEHIGGDAWVSDGIKAIIDKDPDWRAIFATFGSIDKILHALGEHESPTQATWAINNHLTLKDTLKLADDALGEVLNSLEEKGQLEETVLVVTSDHGGQVNNHFHGLTQPGLGTNYLFYGKTANKENLVLPQILAPLMQSSEIEAISHDSSIKIWTKTLNRLKLSKLSHQVSELPGVAEIYTLNRTGNNYHYIRTYRSPNLKDRPLEWANRHNADLLESMAQNQAPTLVALLLDRHGYGLEGDHGGTQEQVQRIPLIISTPNLLAEKRGVELPDEVRLVDINPIISRIVGLPLPAQLEGSAKSVEGLFQ